ncbi:MAG: phosphatase PAP2 family protein [Thermoplasmata archaeon]
MNLKNRKKTLFLVSLASLVILTILVMSGAVSAFNEAVLKVFTVSSDDHIYAGFALLTYMGNTLFLTATSLLIIYLLYRSGEKRLSYGFTGMMFLCGVAVFVLKFVIRKPRPTSEGIYYLAYGYPSGHTAGAFTFFLGSYVFYFMLYKGEQDLFYLSLSLVLASIVAVSRLVLGVHYLTDVLGGLFLAATLISYFWMKMSDQT